MKKSGNPKNKDFFTRVYEVAVRIPPGRVTSYGAIARYLGSGQSARMVGWALNHCNTYKEFVPAHRVVNKVGLLTGSHHFGTATAMEQLLENEGIKIEDHQVIDFEKIFWDPNRQARKKVGKR
jgi:methylated-DNA-protein-cysteine methyltransferase related protein